MKSIKAPANLSRRDTKQFILDQRADAIEFGQKIKDEVVSYLKFGAEEELEPYIDAAAARINIRYGFSNEKGFSNQRIIHHRDDKPQWMHVWSFKGTARSYWADTNMVIRTDGNLNVEHLCESILRMANDDLRGVKNTVKRLLVAEEVASYVAPDGYRVTPEAYGVVVTYLGAYSGSKSLSHTVKPSKVAALIEAHQKWVIALKEAT